MLRNLIDKKLVDYVAMDIKAPLEPNFQFSLIAKQLQGAERLIPISNFQSKYEKVIGLRIDLDKIKKSIGIIKGSGIDYEFRTTVVPTIHTKEDIVQIAKDISPAKKYFLQNFRPEKTIDPDFEKIKPYPDEYLSSCCQAISPFFDTCQIR